MAPLTDPERLAAYRDAAANWRFDGYIQFDMPASADRWLALELNGISYKEIASSIAKFVSHGGAIDEVREHRELWRDQYEYHYDLRLTIQEKSVYIETRLLFTPPFIPDAPSILVVNIHAP